MFDIGDEVQWALDVTYYRFSGYGVIHYNYGSYAIVRVLEVWDYNPAWSESERLYVNGGTFTFDLDTNKIEPYIPNMIGQRIKELTGG